ncbi:MAG: hypothetical protein ACRDRN_28450, partial [Sciscionella sp.]
MLTKRAERQSKPRWTKDTAGASVASWGAWYVSCRVISEVASNHHSTYPNTIGAIGGAVFAGLAYVIMLR